MAKVLYQSDAVIMSQGPDAIQEAANMAGHSVEHTRAMHEFALEIIAQSIRKGLTPEQCYTACLNAMCAIIGSLSDSQDKATLVGATTEALCAFVGGGSDNGVRG